MSPGGGCYEQREEGCGIDSLTPLRETLGRTGNLSGRSALIGSPLDFGSFLLTIGSFGPSNHKKEIRGKLVLGIILDPKIKPFLKGGN